MADRENAMSDTNKIRWRLSAKKDRTPLEDQALGWLKIAKLAEPGGQEARKATSDFVEELFRDAAEDAK